MEISLKELAEKLEAPFSGDGGKMLRGVAPLEVCGPDQISYAVGEKWLKKLKKSRAGAVVTKEDPGIDGLNCILHDQPQLAFIAIIMLFHPEERSYVGVSPKAEVAETATLAEPVSVGPFVSIGEGASIGARTVISPGVVIGKQVVIGSDCTLHPNVVIEDRCELGDRVIIHAGSIIGADGFGYIQQGGKSLKVPQVGGVRIGNDVELGANVCIDRGTIGDTVIGNGVKVDNLVQIAHNVVVGDHAVIVAQVGLAGSATIGKGAVLAGQSGVTEHVETGDGVMVAAQSLVTKDVKPGAVVAGTPAFEIEMWRKARVIERNLPKYWSRIVELLKEWEKEKE